MRLTKLDIPVRLKVNLFSQRIPSSKKITEAILKLEQHLNNTQVFETDNMMLGLRFHFDGTAMQQEEEGRQ